MMGYPSYTDFLSSVTYEIYPVYTALLSGSIYFSTKFLATFYLLLRRIGKREFCSTLLKEVIVLVTKSTIGHGASYATRAAELGGLIVGSYGPDVVSELLTQSLPLLVPVISSTSFAQMVAYFTWHACCISQIFTTTDCSEEVANAKIHCFLFFTELLERQCCAPAPLLALPVTFFSLAITSPSWLRYAPIPRIAAAFRKLHCSNICAGLFDLNDIEGQKQCFKYYNSLI
jgi:hypothetical protein